MSEQAIPHFQRLQKQFTDYIRNPNNPIPAGIDPERIAVYRRSVLNNLVDFLGFCFPVIKTILNETEWETLISDYLMVHRATSPLFQDIPSEFLLYLQTERHDPNDLPFLKELAHYEWVEHALYLCPELLPAQSAVENPDILSTHWQLSPLSWAFSYHYPVHKITTDNQPTGPSTLPNYLCIYRDRALNVGFMTLNVATANMINLLQQHNNGLTGEALLSLLSAQYPPKKPQEFHQSAKEMMTLLFKKDIIFTHHLINKEGL